RGRVPDRAAQHGPEESKGRRAERELREVLLQGRGGQRVGGRRDQRRGGRLAAQDALRGQEDRRQREEVPEQAEEVRHQDQPRVRRAVRGVPEEVTRTANGRRPQLWHGLPTVPQLGSGEGRRQGIFHAKRLDV